MTPAEYEQKQRLLELAKAHTAELMAKMDELPPEQRQDFLRNQVRVRSKSQVPVIVANSCRAALIRQGAAPEHPASAAATSLVSNRSASA